MLADVEDVERGIPSQIAQSNHPSQTGSGSSIDLVIVDYDITDCFSLMNHHNDDDDMDHHHQLDENNTTTNHSSLYSSNPKQPIPYQPIPYQPIPYQPSPHQSHPRQSNSRQSHSQQSNLEAATELLVRRILAHESRPALIFTNVAVSSTGSWSLLPAPQSNHPSQTTPSSQIPQSNHASQTTPSSQISQSNHASQTTPSSHDQKCYPIGSARAPVLKAYGVPIIRSV